MIESIHVVNIPSRDPDDMTDKPLNWFTVGDILDVTQKSVLFTWDNGIWKSTFLKTLLASLRRNRSFAAGEWWDKLNDPYGFFSLCWDDDIISIFEQCIAHIYEGGIVNIFDLSSSLTSNEEQFTSFLWNHMEIIDMSLWGDARRELMSKFVEWAKLYSKKYDISIETIYPQLMHFISGTWWYFKTNANMYGWLVPNHTWVDLVSTWSIHTILDGGKMWTYFARKDLTGQRKYASVLDRETYLPTEWWQSLGQGVLELIGRVKESADDILILDEPTNWLWEGSIWNIVIPTMKNLHTRNNQAFVASHNGALIKTLRRDPNWLVVKLPLKSK